MTQPELVIVVDTEEEFDWNRDFSRAATATRSIPAQARAHEIYDRYNVVPTYVIDYPVATDPEAVAYLRGLVDAGKAEIGAHLHPWVTPPHDEEVSRRNSYHCNLPPALERAKLAAITDAIEAGFGARPTIFKAGRHGFGASTAAALAALGYKVDCSMVPHTSYAADGGPDFRRVPESPHWLDAAAGLLEVPTTVGYFGALPTLGAKADWLFDHPCAGRLHLPGILARTGLVTRTRLTPEGVPVDEQCRLIEAMLRRGRRTFTLTYHSPSLAPGNTPYVHDEAGLRDFLGRIEAVLRFFRDSVGGRFTTLREIHARWTVVARQAA